MRKVVMLSAAAILGIASIAVSQAEDIVDTPVTISEVEEGQEAVDKLPQMLGDEVKAAADFALESKFPSSEELYTDVYI